MNTSVELHPSNSANVKHKVLTCTVSDNTEGEERHIPYVYILTALTWNLQYCVNSYPSELTPKGLCQLNYLLRVFIYDKSVLTNVNVKAEPNSVDSHS